MPPTFPIEKPSELKAVTASVTASSSSLLSGNVALPTPRAASWKTAEEEPELRFFIHSISGCISELPSNVIDCVPPFPVYKAI